MCHGTGSHRGGLPAAKARSREPTPGRVEALLTRGRGVRLVGIDRGQSRASSELRALHGIRTPDALQIAAALSARCEAFVTNDRDLPEIPGLRILQLRDYLTA